MRGRYLLFATLVLVLIGCADSVRAQLVELERGTRVHGLWCFPIMDRPNEWVYIPSQSRLSTDDQGRPNFSFIRYAFNREASDDPGVSISQASGGGILHFLIEYETPQPQIEQAQQQLRERFENDELALIGPLIFNSGRYTLISSILNGEGIQQRHILATGTAPVMEGNRLALSFHMEPEQAMLLMESFQMETPDISIVFDLEFSGITDAYEARVFVDWSQVRQTQSMSAGGTVYFVSADVKAEFDRLVRDNVIRMESVGANADMEALIARIYERLLELMFNPVPPERVPADQRGSLSDALGAMIGQDGLLSSGNTTGFGAHVGYQLKDLRWEGETVLDFNHRDRVARSAYITFNIGDLYDQYGEDSNYFRAVNPGDPTFDQREIQLAVDGDLLPEFEKLVNSVTVTMRKTHAGGDTTLAERVLNERTLLSGEALAPMVYGWRDDVDRIDWLDYEYRTNWSFRGGGRYQTDWVSTNTAMIELYAPFLRQQVQIVPTGVDLAGLGVLAIMINLEYPFFGTRDTQSMVIRSDRPEGDSRIELTLPRDRLEYDYRMTWIMADGSRPQIERSDSTGLIFLDPPPN